METHNPSVPLIVYMSVTAVIVASGVCEQKQWCIAVTALTGQNKRASSYSSLSNNASDLLFRSGPCLSLIPHLSVCLCPSASTLLPPGTRCHLQHLSSLVHVFLPARHAPPPPQSARYSPLGAHCVLHRGWCFFMTFF